MDPAERELGRRGRNESQDRHLAGRGRDTRAAPIRRSRRRCRSMTRRAGRRGQRSSRPSRSHPRPPAPRRGRPADARDRRRRRGSRRAVRPGHGGLGISSPIGRRDMPRVSSDTESAPAKRRTSIGSTPTNEVDARACGGPPERPRRPFDLANTSSHVAPATWRRYGKPRATETMT